MNEQLEQIDYSLVVDYYELMEKIYKKIWGSHIHFGIFPDGPAVQDYNLDDAGEGYTRELVSHGLQSLALHRRLENDLVIVELCCGYAPIYPTLLSMGIRGSYNGIDLLSFAISHNKNMYPEGSSDLLKPVFINKSVEHFLSTRTELKGNVDLIVCQDSFYHIKNKSNVLKAIGEFLRPGGILLFSDLAIHQSLTTDKQFEKFFIRRQAKTKPLIFGQEKGQTEIFEFDQLLREAGLFKMSLRDHTSDLWASYNKASANIMNIENNGFSGKGILSELRDSFEFLETVAKNGMFRLVWWVAARKSRITDNTQKTGKPGILICQIDKEGFSYNIHPLTHKRIKNKLPILDEMRIEIGESEYVGLVGKTGIGKTTLLHGVMNLLESNKHIQIHQLKQKMKIVMVHQEPLLLEDFTVKSSVEFVFKACDNIKERIINLDTPLKILIECNLGEVANTLTQNLSRGQKQRASIAVALAANPDILLLDEPLASQDFIQRRLMINLFKTIRQGDNVMSIVHVTHRWDDVKELADRCLEISGGQLLEVDKSLICK